MSDLQSDKIRRQTCDGHVGGQTPADEFYLLQAPCPSVDALDHFRLADREYRLCAGSNTGQIANHFAVEYYPRTGEYRVIYSSPDNTNPLSLSSFTYRPGERLADNNKPLLELHMELMQKLSLEMLISGRF